MTTDFGLKDFDDNYFIPDGVMLSDEDMDVMQFTGLLDKKEKEIYEGDILKWRDSEHLLEVRWGSVGWVYYSTLFKSFGHPIGDTCSEFNTKGYLSSSEIIGNVYENPELLPNPKEV